MPSDTPIEALDAEFLQSLMPEDPQEASAFISTLKQTYASSSASCLRGIRAAVQALDGAALMQAAHALKGACLSLGARGMVRVLVALEQCAASLTWDRAPALLEDLERENDLVPRGFDKIQAAF